MKRVKRAVHSAAMHLLGRPMKKAPDKACISYLSEVRRKMKELPGEDEREFIRYCAVNFERSHSQIFQDLFVIRTLSGKRAGFFCEFGATDGVSLSNSCLLEREYGWRGILAEPARGWHEDLQKNRPTARIDKGCVWTKTGDVIEFKEVRSREFSTIAAFSESDHHLNNRKQGLSYSVDTISLNDLLVKHEAPQSIDYLSMDTEGSELEILKSFDFGRFRPLVLTVEHNYTENRKEIFDLLVGNGYRRMLTACSLFDDWYVSNDIG